MKWALKVAGFIRWRLGIESKRVGIRVRVQQVVVLSGLTGDLMLNRLVNRQLMIRMSREGEAVDYWSSERTIQTSAVIPRLLE